MKFTFEPEARPLDGFTIKRAIHRGGFGEVYYALTDAGREVALKLLQHDTEVELRGVQQCLNLSHPNLVSIFDVRRDGDGDHWIVMEYVSGETLDAAIRRHPEGMPLELIHKWLPGIVAGAHFLHSRGLVHRDLKPANIFVSGQTVKIGDVGLSKFITVSRRSAQTQSVGTVHYMAPEIARGRYGKEVDVYALGVILYEMLTGSPPFDGESTGEILMKHLTAAPDLSRLPPRLRPVLEKALHKDPAQRHSSLPKLLEEFENAVLGRAEARQSAAAGKSCWKKPGCGGWSKQPRDAAEQVLGFGPAWFREASPGVRVAVICGLAFAALHLAPILVPVGMIGAIGYGAYRVAISTGFWAPRFGHALAAPFLAAWSLPLMSRICLSGALVLGAIVFLEQLSRHAHLEEGGKRALIGAFALLLGAWIFAARRTATSVSTEPALPQLTTSRRRGGVVRQRAGVFFHSAALAVPVSALLAGLLALFKPTMFQSSQGGGFDTSLWTFFTLVSIVGVWGISLTRWWGVSRNAQRPISRWTFAALGAGIGGAAVGLSRFLMVDLHQAPAPRAAWRHLGEQPLWDAGVGPTALGYILFFAAVFWLRDWMTLIASNRPQRFSYGAVFSTVFVAWLITLMFPFPLTWGLSWAAVLACTTQIVSPWFPRANGIAPRIEQVELRPTVSR